MDKQEFFSRCKHCGISPSNALQAWNKIQKLEGHIKKNWKVFELMQKYPKDKRLKLREYAAERGFEYTPDELNNLIEFIGLIQENMKK